MEQTLGSTKEGKWTRLDSADGIGTSNRVHRRIVDRNSHSIRRFGRTSVLGRIAIVPSFTINLGVPFAACDSGDSASEAMGRIGFQGEQNCRANVHPFYLVLAKDHFGIP